MISLVDGSNGSVNKNNTEHLFVCYCLVIVKVIFSLLFLFEKSKTQQTMSDDHVITVGQDAQPVNKYKFHLHSDHDISMEPTGAGHQIRLFHPTHSRFQHKEHKDLALKWSARNHRKGRQSIIITVPKEDHAKRTKKEKLRTSLPSLKHLIQPLNISWWVAMFFTVGSVAWVVNGFFVFLPFINSNVQAHIVPAVWTAFAGGTLFEFGAILAVFEALHSQGEKVDFDYKPTKRRIYRLKLRLNLRDLGTIAAFVQLAAASIFWISTIAGLVPAVIENPLGGLAIGLFWTEQVVGGSGFAISSLIIMYETQKKWWMIINLRALGWHVGFWNLVGAVGFLLCGALGYSSGINYGTAYQSGCSTFWGSWAFLIGSVIQLYEAIDRNPTHHVSDEKTADVTAEHTNSEEQGNP
jgi:hypothetical protein